MARRRISVVRKPESNPTTYVCYNCGSDDVEQRAWYNAKTGNIDIVTTNDEEDTWCNNCQEHVVLKKA